MRKRKLTAMAAVVFALLLVYGCADTAVPQSTVPSSGNAAQNTAAPQENIPYPEVGLSVERLCQACQTDAMINYLWLSDEEIFLDGTKMSEQDGKLRFDVRWFLWTPGTGELRRIYEGIQAEYGTISEVTQSTADTLVLRWFGGGQKELHLETASLTDALPPAAAGLDPLTTCFDAEQNRLFFLDGQQLKLRTAKGIEVLYTLPPNHYPRTLTLSPDKKKFAFSVVNGPATAAGVVTVELDTLTATFVEKTMVMPFYCWLGDELYAIENREEGTSKIYYGPELRQELAVEYPVKAAGNGFLDLAEDKENLGGKKEKIPFVKEYRAESGEWKGEVGLLSAPKQKPVLETLATLTEKNIAATALSPNAKKLLFVTAEAFTGKNSFLQIVSVPD